MKELMRLKKISIAKEGREIVRVEELTIKENSIIGIVGANGSGKSTLLTLLAQELKDFQGTFFSELEPSEITFVQQEQADFTAPQNKGDFTKTFINWQIQNGYQQLSGGEKLKQRLKVGFQQKAKLLLLDEPTNHLDEESVAELVKTLKNYRGTVVLVSHDRQFLDDVVDEIWSIEDREVQSYQGNYQRFKKLREAERSRQASEFIKQEKEIKKIQNEMARLANWSEKAHRESTSEKKSESKMGAKEYFRMKAKKMDRQRKSIEKRLTADLATKTVQRVKDEASVKFELPGRLVKQGPLYLVENLSKSFSDRPIFTKANFTIQYGEHLAITGANGSGKSTLLKILLEEESYQGEVWRSKSAKVGYLSQEVFDLPDNKTIAAYLDLPRSAESQVKTLFVNLGFEIQQWQEFIWQLSMGERVKLKLMLHIIQEKNVLILDEPTNHLDIPSREQLEKVLQDYQGTLIFVSHDPYFREQVATRILELNEGKIVEKQEVQPAAKGLDKFVLEFRKDELLSLLSSQPSSSFQYQEAEEEFNQVLQQLKELKE